MGHLKGYGLKFPALSCSACISLAAFPPGDWTFPIYKPRAVKKKKSLDFKDKDTMRDLLMADAEKRTSAIVISLLVMIVIL